MKNSRIITLLTDFGQQGGFVGALKGVILSTNPNVQLVDITHEISPQNVFEAAFTLFVNYRYFPKDTIHVAVVDPGVGSKRKIMCARAPNPAFSSVRTTGFSRQSLTARKNSKFSKLTIPNFFFLL